MTSAAKKFSPGLQNPESFDFSFLFQTERTIFSVGGPDGFFKEVNPAFERLLGRTRRQLLDHSLFEFVFPADIPKTLQWLFDLETNAVELAFENRWVHADGSIRWLVWVAKTNRRDGHWYATAHDVTESRETQESLLAVQQRLSLALSVAQAGSWEWDISEDRLTLDAGAEVLMGLLPGQYRGRSRSLLRLILRQDRSKLLKLIRTSVESAGSFEADFRLRADLRGTRYIVVRGRVVARDRRSRPQRAVGIGFDSTSQKAFEEQLLALVLHDPLTGLRNRRSFDQTLRREWRRAVRSKRPLAVLMIDVDEFKRYNDCFGHQAGDQALCSVARALGDEVGRSADLLARYGGEEFVALLPETSIEQAQAVAERLLDALRGLALPHAESTHKVVTASIGAASLVPDDTGKVAELLSAADHALYRAKRLGRNRVEC